MRFAVAIASPPKFQHSRAFDEVAEGLHHALLALGHDSVVTDRLDLDERRTIVLGGNLLVRHGLQPPKDAIFYNLEQLGDDLPSMTLPGFLDLFRRYPTWDYSPANIKRLAALGLPQPTFVPIGYVPELTRIAPAVEDIDVLFYGAPYERRYAILRNLHDRGLRVKWLSGVYGATRDAWIARSKIVLNIHYWEAKIFEITRVSYLLANRRAVVSERGADPALELDVESGVAFADYDGLVDRCVELLGDEPARRELAERGYQVFSARSQADILHRALSELEVPPRETAALARVDVHLEDHELRERRLFKHKIAPDRDAWLADVQRDPEDARSVFFLAETCFQLDEFVDARMWYARRIELGGCDEETYWAMFRLAESMAKLGEPWPEVQRVYLKASEFRPTRAEALHAIAFRYRNEQQYQLGYQFAKRADAIPNPEGDLFVIGYFAEVYAWRAADELAVCAFWIGEHAEAFTLCRRLLARPDLPESDRQRIATNRDYSVPAMLEAATPYPKAVAHSLHTAHRPAEVTVSLITGPHRHTTEHTLNSFLNCCLDLSRIGRFLILDTGLPAPERATLQQHYEFLDFIDTAPNTSPAAQLAQLHTHINTRFWLHLGHGWQFFTPEHYITRLTAVLNAEPQVFQVGINLTDATTLTGTCAPKHATRHTPQAGRYLLTNTMARGPAMFDTTRLDHAINTQPNNPTRVAARTATLDEILCLPSKLLSVQRPSYGA